nr:PREDICTED: uncharacterized protein LOC109032655 [Bemisia tabaci]
MPVRWEEAETLRFVKLYKERQCLWDPSLPEYRNNKVRNDAYEELQAEMRMPDFSINDVKQKIKNLRNTYTQEVAKIEKAINAGSSYQPQMKWFLTMDKLVRKIRDNQPSLYYREKNKLESRQVEEPDEKDGIGIEMCNDGEEIEIDEHIFQQQQQQPSIAFHEQPPVFEEPRPNTDNEYSQNYENHMDDNPTTPTPDHSAGPSRKRRRTVVTSALRKLEQVGDSLQELLEDEDEWDAFGNFVGLSLKRLPMELALDAEAEIQATLSKFKRMQHNLNPNPQASTQTQQQSTTTARTSTTPEPTLTFYMNEKDAIQIIE